MLKVTLPGLYTKKELNFLFLDYCQSNKDYLIDNKIYFTVSGSIPQNTWAGHRNIEGNLILYNDIINLIATYEKKEVKLRFDCSNLIIDEKDYNVFGKVLLDCGNNGSNQIEISTPQAYNHFIKAYPNYDYVGSKSMIDFDQNIDLSILVRATFNQDSPDYIKAGKIERIIFSPCIQCSNEQQTQCLLQESLNTNTFSKNTIYNCQKMVPVFINNETLKVGSRIQIEELPSLIDQLYIYVKILIKPEYQLEAIHYLTKRLEKEYYKL